MFGDPADKDVVLDAVAAAAVGQASGPHAKVDCGRALQDWTNLGVFLRKAVWEKLKQGDSGGFLDELVRMGLRRPSEPTMQTIALIALSATEGVVSVAAMDAQMKLTYIQSCKAMFKARIKGVPTPTACLPALPISANELPADVRREWYGDEGPAPSEISEVELAQLRATTRMRGVKRAGSALALPAPPAASSRAAQQLVDLFAAALAGVAQPQGLSEPVIQMMPARRNLHLQLPQPRALLPALPTPPRATRSVSFDLGGQAADEPGEAQVALNDDAPAPAAKSVPTGAGEPSWMLSPKAFWTTCS